MDIVLKSLAIVVMLLAIPLLLFIGYSWWVQFWIGWEAAHGMIY